MKKKTFQLFSHENLEIKNNLINTARQLSKKKDDAANMLASTLIYASLAEYLGGNLLENLRYLMHEITYRDYAGIVFIDERDDERKRTMGQIAVELKKYAFPDKEKILELINIISDARNNVFHNLAKASHQDAEPLERDIETIIFSTEALLDKINVVYAGLKKILLPIPPIGSDNKTSPVEPKAGS